MSTSRTVVFQDTNLLSTGERETLRERARPSLYASLTGVLGHYVRLAPDRTSILRQLSQIQRSANGYALGRAITRCAGASAPPPIDIPADSAAPFPELYNEYCDYLPPTLRALLPAQPPLSTVGNAASAACPAGRLGVVRLDGAGFTQRDLETEYEGRRIFAVLFEYERPLTAATSTGTPQSCFRAAIWDGQELWMPVPGFVVRHSQGGTSHGTGLGFTAQALARSHASQLKLGRPVMAFTCPAEASRQLALAVNTGFPPAEAISPTTQYFEPSPPRTVQTTLETIQPIYIEKPASQPGMQFPQWMYLITPLGWNILAIIALLLALYTFIGVTFWLAWIGGSGSKNLKLDTLLVDKVTSLGHVGISIAEMPEPVTWKVGSLIVTGTSQFNGNVTGGESCLASFAKLQAQEATTSTLNAINSTLTSATLGTATVSTLAMPAGTATIGTATVTNLSADNTTFTTKISANDIDYSAGVTFPGNVAFNGAVSLAPGATFNTTGGITTMGAFTATSGSVQNLQVGTIGAAAPAPAVAAAAGLAAAGGVINFDSGISLTGDLSVSGVSTLTGLVTATGGVTSAATVTAATLAATTTVTTPAISVTGDATVTGAVNAGSVVSTGNVEAANVTATETVSGANVSATSVLKTDGRLLAAPLTVNPTEGVQVVVDGNMRVTGDLHANLDLTGSDLTVNNLTVTGTGEFTSDTSTVQIAGGVNVGGDATLGVAASTVTLPGKLVAGTVTVSTELKTTSTRAKTVLSGLTVKGDATDVGSGDALVVTSGNIRTSTGSMLAKKGYFETTVVGSPLPTN